jgi:shikimate kinase
MAIQGVIPDPMGLRWRISPLLSATMNLVLLGYRASGKTTLGKALAQSLKWDFVDTDEATRQRFGGRAIAQVWADEGEPAFRAAECDVVAEVLSQDQTVIALGGGTPMQPRARAALEAAADRAIRVYLKAPAQILSQRIDQDAQSGAERPALTPHGGGLEEVRSVLAEREPVYLALADEIFDTTHLTLEATDEAVAHLAGLVAQI